LRAVAGRLHSGYYRLAPGASCRQHAVIRRTGLPAQGVDAIVNIFISYRRDDSSGYAGRLYDRLAAHFGRPNVFMDIEALEPGVDFVDGIDQAMDACGALVVLIGSEWLSATDAQGRRRLDDPNDFVRLEIANALRRDLCVLPVLVNGAVMPSAQELPPELAPLARRQAQELSNSRWDFDVGHLITALERWLARAAGTGPVTVGNARQGVQPLPPRDAHKGQGQRPREAPAGTPAWVWPAAVALLLGVLAWGAVTWLRDVPTESPPVASSEPPPEPAPPEPVLPERRPPEPLAREPIPSEPGPQGRSERIQALLEQAEADLRANRLTRPAEANAFSRYQEVLELAPGHPAALEGLQHLGHRYLELAAGALERGQRDQAHAYLDQAQRFVPDAPELAGLRERAAVPQPAPEPEWMQQCLRECDARLAACRAEAQASGGVEACMAQRREHCEAQLDECKGDAQKLMLWGQVSTESACNGEYHHCMQRAEAACEQAGQDPIRACEARAEDCRQGCLTR
jgi:hypothetical protein